MIQLYSLFFTLMLTACFAGCDSPTEATKPNLSNYNTTQVREVKDSEGKKMFRANCQSCHLFENNLVAPPLVGLTKKWNSKKDLYAYMRNPVEYINTRKDQRIIQLHKEYKIMMPPFSFLKDAELDSIFQYVDAYERAKSE